MPQSVYEQIAAVHRDLAHVTPSARLADALNALRAASVRAMNQGTTEAMHALLDAAEAVRAAA